MNMGAELHELGRLDQAIAAWDGVLVRFGIGGDAGAARRSRTERSSTRQ